MKKNILLFVLVIYGNNLCAAHENEKRSLCQSPRFQQALETAEEHFGEDGAFVPSHPDNQDRLKIISAALALTDLASHSALSLESGPDIPLSEESSSSLPDFISRDGVHCFTHESVILRREQSASLDTLASHAPVVSFSENDADDEATDSVTDTIRLSALPDNQNKRNGMVIVLEKRPPTPWLYSVSKEDKSCQTDQAPDVCFKQGVENLVHAPVLRSHRRGFFWYFTCGCVRKNNP